MLSELNTQLTYTTLLKFKKLVIPYDNMNVKTRNLVFWSIFGYIWNILHPCTLYYCSKIIICIDLNYNLLNKIAKKPINKQ